MKNPEYVFPEFKSDGAMSSLGCINIRTYAAIQAMNGVLSSNIAFKEVPQVMAEWAVKQADALLAELEKTK